MCQMENVCAGAHQIKKRQKSTTPASETNFAFYVPQCEVECMWKGFGMIPREVPSSEVNNLVAREARVYHTSIARPA